MGAVLHDAAESYVGDMVRPIKKRLPEFGRLEEFFFESVCQRFNLVGEMPEEVIQADTQILHAEVELLFDFNPNERG